MSLGFDKRNVSFEKIHNITEKDWNAMLNAVNPQPREVILDAMSGYGAVTKQILKKEPKADLFLIDESKVQMEMAKKNLSNLAEDHFIIKSILEADFAENSFDTIVMKMGLHEVTLEKQKELLEKMYALLKVNGKLIIWDFMLNKRNQTLFQEIIRKKDGLAGYDSMVKNRYFFQEDEFLELMKQARFSQIRECHVIKHKRSTLKNLKPDFHDDKEKLNALNEFIRDKFPEELKEQMEYEDRGDDIQFTVLNKIFMARK